MDFVNRERNQHISKFSNVISVTILLFQIRSVSKDRLKEKIGNLEQWVVEELIAGLNDVLRY